MISALTPPPQWSEIEPEIVVPKLRTRARKPQTRQNAPAEQSAQSMDQDGFDQFKPRWWGVVEIGE